MPFEDTYVPLLHLIVAMVATSGKISAVHAYHVVVGIGYSLGPVTLYAMAVYLGAERGSAFLSAMTYSLFSPCALVMPAVARDMTSLLFSRRLQVLTVYGEGPHISALMLLPLVIVALEHALRKRSGRAFALAALMLALVFLVNVPGTMATGLAVFCWLVIQPAGSRRVAWTIAGAAAVLAYLVACYGIPPSSELTVVGNIGRMHHGFSTAAKWIPLLLALLLAAIGAAGAVLSRTRLPLYVRFATVYFALTAVLVLTAIPNRFELLPQIAREQLEMEMGFCLLAGALFWFLYRRSPWRLQLVLGLLFAIGVGYQIQHYRVSARTEISPVDLGTRSEHASAVWADTHLAGQRVYVRRLRFLLVEHLHFDVPQVLGCCDQGMALPVLANINSLIDPPTGPYHEILTKAYLQAFGVQAIVVSGAQSTDEYKNIQVPERFDAMFPVLHRELGDTIYAVPQRSTSLAHVVRPGETVPEPPTVYKVYDYSLVIEDPSRPAADFEWLGDGSARIRATLSKTDLDFGAGAVVRRLESFDRQPPDCDFVRWAGPAGSASGNRRSRRDRAAMDRPARSDSFRDRVAGRIRIPRVPAVAQWRVAVPRRSRRPRNNNLTAAVVAQTLSLMPHSFRDRSFLNERWGGPPRTARDARVPLFSRRSSRPGGRQRTWGPPYRKTMRRGETPLVAPEG